MQTCIEWLFKPETLLIKIIHLVKVSVFNSQFQNIPYNLVSEPLIGLIQQSSSLRISAEKMTTKGSFVQPAIPRFDGHYDHWSMLMENFLRTKEYWELIEPGYVEPASGATQIEAQQKKNNELKLKDLKVKNYLFQEIDQLFSTPL